MSDKKNLISLELTGGSNLSYSFLLSKWYTGNNVGEIETLFSISETIPINNCEKILCLSINNSSNLIAICHEKIVSIYDNNWKELNPLLLRSTLPITHCEFDSTGQYL